MSRRVVSESVSVGDVMGNGVCCSSPWGWCFRGPGKSWSGPGGCNPWSSRSACQSPLTVSAWLYRFQKPLLWCYLLSLEWVVGDVWVPRGSCVFLRRLYRLQKWRRFRLPPLSTWQYWWAGTGCGWCRCWWWGWVVCHHCWRVGRRGENGLWLGYVRVLHRNRTHCLQHGGSCCWHDSGVLRRGGLPCNLITKQCPPWCLCWLGPVLWRCRWGIPTFSGLLLWRSRGTSHRLISRIVWTVRPLILHFRCQHTRSWRHMWSGSNGAGHIGVL